MTVRYAGRPPRSSTDVKAAPRSIDTWSTSLVATFVTDPDALASVLPPPLAPTETPIVKVGISTVELGHGMGPIGAGTFAVSARHGDRTGYYPLLMPMTTEQAVVSGREIYGEPKKLAKISLDVEGEQLCATVARMGTSIIEITGTIGDDLPLPVGGESLDFYFKSLRDPAGGGLDDDAWLVYCTREGETRRHRRVTGTLELRDSKFDPVADFPVLSEPAITLSERSSKQQGSLVERVPAATILPFIHQRYDDLIATVKAQ